MQIKCFYRSYSKCIDKISFQLLFNFSVSNFLSDFYSPAREDVNAEVVFLNKNEPDLEFDGLLKREKTRVRYFQERIYNTNKKHLIFSYFQRRSCFSSDVWTEFSIIGHDVEYNGLVKSFCRKSCCCSCPLW